MWTESFARDAGGAAAPLETVQVDLDGRSVAVLPLWIAVHQPQDGGPARSGLTTSSTSCYAVCPVPLQALMSSSALTASYPQPLWRLIHRW